VRIEALGSQVGAGGEEGIRQGEKLLLLVRPEDITVRPCLEPGTEQNTVTGRIIVSTFAGASTYLEVAVGGEMLRVSVHGSERFDYIKSAGQEIYLKLNRCSVIRTGGEGR
jgi:ABC-type sugar transport system ATPase subunit